MRILNILPYRALYNVRIFTPRRCLGHPMEFIGLAARLD